MTAREWLKKHKIILTLAALVYLAIWAFSSPYSIPLNFMRHCAIALDIQRGGASSSFARSLGRGGSVYFLSAAISAWGDPGRIALMFGVSEYIERHGESLDLNRHILDTFAKKYLRTNNPDIRREYIYYIYSRKRANNDAMVAKMIDIYKNLLYEEDWILARADSYNTPIPFLAKECEEYGQADTEFFSEKSKNLDEGVRKSREKR